MSGNAVKKRQHLAVFRKWGTVCYLCGGEGANTIDHVIPLSKGGKNVQTNMRPAHRLCNQLKGDRMPSKGDARFHDLLKHVGELHDKKQSDYGRDEDPFANVRASMDWGVSAWVGALIRATDKIKRLQKAARGGKMANESVEDSFDDLIVYAGIGKILYMEEKARSESASGDTGEDEGPGTGRYRKPRSENTQNSPPETTTSP